MLELLWNYPVHMLESLGHANGDATVAKSVRKALDKQVAFYEISDDDRRPVLVLRECTRCNGTDDALLSREVSNDRILIMTRWFNCVKLPTDVLESDHPFRKLFPEEHPPHLFLARWDGSNSMALRGDLSRTELANHMFTMLKGEYRKSPPRAVKEITKIIAQYDVADEKIARLSGAVDKETEKRGLGSRKLKKMVKELDKAKAELEALKAKEAKVSKLGLKAAKEKKREIDASEPVASQ